MPRDLPMSNPVSNVIRIFFQLRCQLMEAMLTLHISMRKRIQSPIASTAISTSAITIKMQNTNMMQILELTQQPVKRNLQQPQRWRNSKTLQKKSPEQLSPLIWLPYLKGPSTWEVLIMNPFVSPMKVRYTK